MTGALGMGLASITVYSIGVFTPAIERDLGWSRAQVASGMTLISFISVILAPFVGMFIDRMGPRHIAVPGVLLFCGGIAALGLTTSSLPVWWGLWTFVALSASMIKPTVWTTAVSSMFSKGRGLALSLMLCGTGLGSSLTPILANWLIDQFGWRLAYAGLGAFWALLVFPAVLFLFRCAKDGESPTHDAESGADMLSGLSIREGMLSATFAKLALASFIASLVIVSFVSGLVLIFTWQGHSQASAAGIASLTGLATICGRLLGGYLLDRTNGGIVAGTSLLFPAASATLLILMPGSSGAATLAAVILGASLGVELDAVAYLAGRHFGLRNFGVLFGTISGLLACATGLGPFLTGLSYDHFGGYNEVLYAYVPASLVAAALFFSTGRYPDLDRRETRR